MGWVLLGNQTAVEGVRVQVSEFDPQLDQMYAAALAAGQVGVRDATGQLVDDEPSAALKAARLSARTVKQSLPGKQITSVSTSDEVFQAIADITNANGVVANHFETGTGPAWVEAEDPDLANLLSRKYGCPIGRPADWNGEEVLP